MSSPPPPPSTTSPSFSALSVSRENVCIAHDLIEPYIHRTPLLTCQTLSDIASTARQAGGANPKLNLYFKCENYQRIGAFKARGAYHAVLRLIAKLGIEEVRRKGVVTHSSGNHAQALSLAASTFQIPAYIVMPSISSPSKIAATQALTPHVIFSGSTSQERERKVEEVVEQTGAVLVPPYDHGDIVLGQGTVGLEVEEQFGARKDGQVCTVGGVSPSKERDSDVNVAGRKDGNARGRLTRPTRQLDAIIAPCGGGGLLSGIATYFSDEDDEVDGVHPINHCSMDAPFSRTISPLTARPDSASSRQQPDLPSPSPASSKLSDDDDEFTSDQGVASVRPAGKRQTKSEGRRSPLVFGAEPSFEGADDARRSLATGTRISSVKSLTIADGLRTPLGRINWSIISDPRKVTAIYSVSEEQIKEAMKLYLERAKWFVEPSGAVPLAVILYNEELRSYVEAEQKKGAEDGVVRPWDVAVVISGGNTTVDAIVGLFGAGHEHCTTAGPVERSEAKITMDGARLAENIAG